MTVFLDLVGSWIVRASLIIVMLTLTVNMNNTLYQSNQQAYAKKLITAVDSIMYSDVNEAGYNVSGVTFQTATSLDMQFLGDLNGGGVPETVRYYAVWDSTTRLYTLYRYVNNENSGIPTKMGNTFSTVSFRYYDKNGNTTSTLASIVAVRVNLVSRYVLTNAFATTKGQTKDTMYVSTDFRIQPVNL